MELWIRSQERELLSKVEKILLEEGQIEGKTQYVLRNYISSGEFFRLGIYKSKERALEVLDDIQRTLLPRGILENNDDNDYKFVFHNWNIIYEMPKE